MQTLYRKYRPQSFDEIFAQEPIVKVLQKQIKDGKIGHAYLFAGPRGTGKTTIARLVAKAVNCQSLQNGNPCKRCRTCKSIEEGRFLDLVEIDAASNRGIDEIRKLRERVNFAPSEGKYKVYIIDEVHMLTKDAFNALLKTLEEPPSHIIFILATTEPHKIPATIISRCQRFNFTLAKDEEILDRLKFICKKEKVDFTKEALMAIVSNAGGSFRDSESILEKVLGGMGVMKDKKIDFADVKEILGLAEEKEVKEFVESLLKGDSGKSLNIFDKIISSGANVFQFTKQVLEFLRVLLVDKVSKKDGEFSLSNIVRVITEISSAESNLRATQVKRLPIEVAIVKICSSDIGQSADSLGARVEKDVKIDVKKAIKDIPGKIKRSIIKSKPSVNIREIRESWREIVDSIRPYNHHLSAFFKKAHPVKVHKDILILNVPFRFHKQRIESSTSQTAFADVTEKFFGSSLSCSCQVCNGGNNQDSGKEELFSQGSVALEVLGDIMD